MSAATATRRVIAPAASPAGPDRRTVAVALGIVYVVWGSTYLGIRVAIEAMPPLLMASARFLIAGALLYAWTRRRIPRAEYPHVTLRQWGAAAVVGTALLAAGNGGVSIGEQYIPSGIAALLVATVPLWMAVLAAVFTGLRLSWLAVLGVVLGLAGTALLLRPGAVGGVEPIRLVAFLISPLCWAAGSLYARTAPLPRVPLVATAMEMLCGGAVLLVAGALRGELPQVHPSAFTLRSVAAFVYLIVFGSLVAYTAYVWLLRNASSTLVSTYAYVNPLVAVLLGWAFLSEVVTVQTLVAGGVIAGSVALILLAPARASRHHGVG